MDALNGQWLLLIPLVVIQLVLQVAATRSVVRAPAVPGGNKTTWLVVIWAFQVIGPLAYFAVARRNAVS
jgi:hypothetical protein